MKKEMRITAPNGCKIKKVELVDGEVVVAFEEKERELPKSWEEFCRMFPVLLPHSFAVQRHDLYSDDFMFLQSYNNRLTEEMEKFTGDRATAEAVIALCQLIQLRKCYNGDWAPDWKNAHENKYTIALFKSELFEEVYQHSAASPLFFKTKELRDEFLRYFRPLIEKLKPLYSII